MEIPPIWLWILAGLEKKYKREDLKDKDYRPINGLIPGPKAISVWKLVLAISLDKIHRFILSSVTKITSIGVVSGIKEAYKGLLDGDILVWVKRIINIYFFKVIFNIFSVVIYKITYSFSPFTRRVTFITSKVFLKFIIFLDS